VDLEAEQGRELAAQAAVAAVEQRRAIEQRSAFLLAVFDDLPQSSDPQHCGYQLQELRP